MALTSEGSVTVEKLPETIGGLLAHEARQLYHLVTTLEEIVGESDAQPVVARALDRLAIWRASRIVSTETGMPGVLSTWFDASLFPLIQAGLGRILTSKAGILIEISESPDLQLLRQRRRIDLYISQWKTLLKRLFEVSGLGVPVIAVSDVTAGEFVAKAVHGASENNVDWSHAEVEISDLGMLINNTVKGRGAQYYFFAAEAISAFDATGEHAVREGIRRFGRERGRALRKQHFEEGLPINLQTMMSDFDYGGEGIWKFDEGSLSPSEWSQDCTYCPFAEVWRDFDDGLELGYIYDMEFHVSEFSEYHPGIRVMWDKLQTRGDPVCAFRFALVDS